MVPLKLFSWRQIYIQNEVSIGKEMWGQGTALYINKIIFYNLTKFRTFLQDLFAKNEKEFFHNNWLGKHFLSTSHSLIYKTVHFV